jgi:hypothetical protein
MDGDQHCPADGLLCAGHRDGLDQIRPALFLPLLGEPSDTLLPQRLHLRRIDGEIDLACVVVESVYQA